jgi:DGQHR domain-containing protein
MTQQIDYIEFKCLEIVQPLGKFYIGVMNYDDLINISYADIRRLESRLEQREVEIYSGIQRELSPKRVKEISKYVNLIDATFPTSIILHVEPDYADYDSNNQIMKIVNKNNVAKVIDGQHRISGLESFAQDDKHFQLNITLFVGMELEDQAIVFATINQTQTKVNRSLVADLFEFAKTRSPQKTAHNIVRALNEKVGSPFKDKIKILGTAHDKERETITQSTFVESLIKYITKDKMRDRDMYKRNKVPEKYEGKELRERFFRNLFIEEQDGSIAKIILNYFSAIQNKWPRAWNNIQPELILNRSTGFISLMRFLKNCYLNFAGENIGKIVSTEEFQSIFNRINISDEDFNRENYLPGSGGQSKLYSDLVEKSELV